MTTSECPLMYWTDQSSKQGECRGKYLCDGMHNDIGTEFQRILEKGTHERIVDNEDNILVRVNDIGNSLDVDQTKCRVG